MNSIAENFVLFVFDLGSEVSLSRAYCVNRMEQIPCSFGTEEIVCSSEKGISVYMLVDTFQQGLS